MGMAIANSLAVRRTQLSPPSVICLQMLQLHQCFRANLGTSDDYYASEKIPINQRFNALHQIFFSFTAFRHSSATWSENSPANGLIRSSLF